MPVCCRPIRLRPVGQARHRPHNPTVIGGAERSRRAPAYVAERTVELNLIDDFVNSAQIVLNVFGPGGIGKTVLTVVWENQARRRGLIVTACDLAAGVTPAALLQDIRSQIADYEGISSAAFARFDTVLREQLVVDGVLTARGGADGIFDTLGRLKDPLGIASVVSAAGQATADRLKQRFVNRAALDRYIRGSDRALAEAFVGGLAELAAPDRRVAMILDTYEDAGILDDWLVTHLAPALPPGAHLVVTGRDELTRMNFDWHDLADATVTWSLSELSETESRRYLRHHGLADAATIDRVLAATGGYPLLLMLVCHLAARAKRGWATVGDLAPRDRDEVATQLLGQILRHERAHAVRDVLERGCVAPWLDPGVVAVVLEIDAPAARRLYDELATHSFCERHPRGLRLQDKIRELLRARFEFTDPAGYADVVARLNAYLAELDQAANAPPG